MDVFGDFITPALPLTVCLQVFVVVVGFVWGVVDA